MTIDNMNIVLSAILIKYLYNIYIGLWRKVVVSLLDLYCVF